MPELAIVGYGKMGKLIEQLAPEYGFAVALKLDEFNNATFEGLTPENFRGIDVAIDFSIPVGGARQRRAHRGAGRQHGDRHHGLAGPPGRRQGAPWTGTASAWSGAPITPWA